METAFFWVAAVVVVALVFDFTNGFHDAANAIATVVATKALSLKQALAMAAVLNLAGAFFATAVAQTIEHGLVRNIGDPHTAQMVVLAALMGATLWNLITWAFAMPSSSSHALVGGLVGAGFVYGHSRDILWSGIWNKVVVPMLFSPLVGAAFAIGLMLALRWGLRRWNEARREEACRHLQIGAGALMAFSHGSNDAQKTMGIITLALVGAGWLPEGSAIPAWVILLCALAMALGTWTGGKRIIRTAGEKITALDQESGLTANVSGSLAVLLASRAGMPVSTTHVVVGAITGAGVARHRGGQGRSVHWLTWRNMIFAWILTLPGAAGMGAALFLGFRYLFP
jgi:PiT family inorganic phosphate transporter